MGVFHVFKIVRMVQNRAKHHILTIKSFSTKLNLNEIKRTGLHVNAMFI